MKDTKGREWTFRFTALTVRELANETQLDTKALTGDRSLIVRIGEDEATLYLCLWVTIRRDAQKMGVSEEEWFEALDDECLQAAAEEWLESYVNFSHPARRQILLKALKATQRKMAEAQRTVEKAIASGNVDEAIEQAIEQAFGAVGSSASSSERSQV